MHPINRDQQSSLFGSGSNGNVQVAEINFLSSLPARDSDPILPAHLTSDPTRAAFVEVTVEPIRMPTILPASIFGGSNVLTAGAKAVAGFDQVVCNFTPIFICNPFETPGMSYGEATEALVNASNDPAGQHKLIRLAGTQEMIGTFGPREFRISHSNDGFFAIEACGPIREVA